MSTQEKSLRDIQLEVGAWSREQFGNNVSKDKFSVCFQSPLGPWPAFAGVVEEIGEYARALARPHQGRWKEEKNGAVLEAKKDAMADLLIFLSDLATREGIDLQEVLNTTWETVQKRRQATWVEDKEKEQVVVQPLKGQNLVCAYCGGTGLVSCEWSTDKTDCPVCKPCKQL